MTPLEAKNLLGFADNCTAQINFVGNDCYRINIYKKVKEEDSIMFVNSIVSSHYIRCVDGVFIDETNKN